jgi:hypothetical protein
MYLWTSQILTTSALTHISLIAATGKDSNIRSV